MCEGIIYIALEYDILSSAKHLITLLSLIPLHILVTPLFVTVLLCLVTPFSTALPHHCLLAPLKMAAKFYLTLHEKKKMFQVEALLLNEMSALEALLGRSSDWPGNFTLNSYWLNFSRAKQNAMQEADWSYIIFYFYDKKFFVIHNKKPRD